jgi:hypothetical protein
LLIEYCTTPLQRPLIHTWQTMALTIVLSASASIRSSLMRLMKKAILDGLPRGCLNARVETSVSQYSSSQSAGRSTSKLCG